MTQPDPRLSDLAAIMDLNAYFAWLIDHRDGHGVPGLFTPAGRYGYEGFWCEGIDEIEDFYERRRRPGTRKSRHVFTNVWVRFRSEEHTSELQSLMRISYAVFCLKKKNTHT